jgi:hypothetical protein
MKNKIILFAILLTVPFFAISQTVASINKPIMDNLDDVAPFSEGLAAVRKGNQWGFIDKTGKLVIDFRDDIVWNDNGDPSRRGVEGIKYPQFKEGFCYVQKLDDQGIPHYGFIDTSGNLVVEPEFLNLSHFDDGYAIGIYVRKDFKGKNEFSLNIYDYTFTELIINTSGEMVWPISERKDILMSKRMYKLPELRAKMLSSELLSNQTESGTWEVIKLNL